MVPITQLRIRVGNTSVCKINSNQFELSQISRLQKSDAPLRPDLKIDPKIVPDKVLKCQGAGTEALAPDGDGCEEEDAKMREGI